MTKKGFKASGRMSVERFEKLFVQEFGVYCATELNPIYIIGTAYRAVMLG